LGTIWEHPSAQWQAPARMPGPEIPRRRRVFCRALPHPQRARFGLRSQRSQVRILPRLLTKSLALAGLCLCPAPARKVDDVGPREHHCSRRYVVRRVGRSPMGSAAHTPPANGRGDGSRNPLMRVAVVLAHADTPDSRKDGPRRLLSSTTASPCAGRSGKQPRSGFPRGTKVGAKPSANRDSAWAQFRAKRASNWRPKPCTRRNAVPKPQPNDHIFFRQVCRVICCTIAIPRFHDPYPRHGGLTHSATTGWDRCAVTWGRREPLRVGNRPHFADTQRSRDTAARGVVTVPAGA
jgi:hypothetical protein